MFLEDEIISLLFVRFEAEKNLKPLGKKKTGEKEDIPNYYPGYAQMVLDAERLRTHYDMDKKPVRLLKEKAPRQSKEEFDWLMANYKPITTSYWGSAENSVNRIWNPDNFTVEFEEDIQQFKLQPAEEYFTKEVPFFGSIFNYFAGVETKWKIRDPNAVIASKPAKIPSKLDKNGDLVVDDTELIAPIPVIYQIKQILDYAEESHLLVETGEKSFVKRGNKKVRTGRVFEFYDENTIWKIIQVGNEKKLNFTKSDFEIVVFWQHNLGFLPAVKLKGLPIQEENMMFYESHFKPALPNLDSAVVYNFNLDASIINQVYPHKWQMVDKCTCVNGQVRNEKNEWVTCKDCKDGSRSSPLKTLEVKIPGKLDGAAQIPPTPPLGFEAPDINTLDFLDSKILRLIVDAFRFMNINVASEASFSDKGSTEKTATETVIDREEFFSFLIVFSKEVFDTLNFTIKSMGKMRYGTEWEPPVIIEPVNFKLRTFEELIKELKIAREAGVPDIFFTKLLQEISKVRFNTDKDFKALLDLALKVDSLIGKTAIEISTGIGNKTISKEDVALHNNLLMLIEQEHQARIKDKVGFFDLDFEEQKKILTEKAKIFVIAETNSAEDIAKKLGIGES